MGSLMKNVSVVEIEPYVFRSLDGSETMIYHSNQGRQPAHILFDGRPHYAFERIQWYETPKFNHLLLGISLILLLSALVSGLVGASCA